MPETKAQRSAAARKGAATRKRQAAEFVDTVDEALLALGERPSRRQEIVDAAMEMAERLVHTQYDFLRSVVKSAGEALSRQDDGK